jgi:4-oxalocrotonate tautomerase
MPIVSIRTIKGILTEDKKAELHKRIADLLVEVEGEGNEEFRQLVIVTIDEDEPEHFSMGGVPASKEFIDALLGR